MDTTHSLENAQAENKAAFSALADVEARAFDTFARRSAKHSELAAKEADLRKLRTEAAIDGPSAGNTRDQAAVKEKIAKLQADHAEIEADASVFDEAIAQAADRVIAAHNALEAAIRERAKKELDAVCAELKAVADPLIARALGLYPAAHGWPWHSQDAEGLLKSESLKLHRVEPDPPPYERPCLPSAAQKAAERRRRISQTPPTPPQAQASNQGVSIHTADMAAKAAAMRDKERGRDPFYGQPVLPSETGGW